VSQRLILAGARSGLLTHTATTEGVLSSVRMKFLTAFVELERAIHEFAVSLISEI